ncbi:MAG: hypothetical protein KDF64_08455 [Geminicoccaceae bacterium]|nr:hypothetical protein [Geminicoccaceae bacterium]
MKLKFQAALVPALLATTALYPASRAWALEVPSGGTVSAINRSGQHYRIHTFNTANDGTDAFDIPTSWPGGTLTADYLIVGGGGSGIGSWYGEGGSLYQYTGAGGGGGGMIETLSQSIGAAAYDVTVGAGGTNPNNARLYGEKGGNSAFNGETALGGGTPVFTTGLDTLRNGGSGGGGGIVQTTSLFTTYPPGTGTAGQGYQGGSSASAPPNDGIAGGGGGGAGGAGGDASPYVGGNGGNGRQSAITGLFYGGGGGGVYSGGYGAASAGAGGTGGGGAGSPSSTMAENGADGRGGGGGGAFSTYFAGDGGDGTVVIAYYLPPPEVTLSSPATSPVNQFTVTAEFTLAPNPSSFTTGDITITNGTASNLQLVSTGTGNNAGAIYSFDVTSTSDGAIDVQIASASFTDTVGVASTTPSNQLAYTADTTAPAAPTGPVIADADDSAAKGDFITSVEQPDISGTAEANSTVEILVGGIKVGETTADGSGNWTYSFGAGELSEGDNSVTMTAKDAAGNVSPASPAQNITVDTIAPQLLAITIDPTSVKYGETADIAFTFNEAVAGFSKDDVTLDTGSIGAVTVDPGDPKIYHATFTPAVDFEGTVNVTVAASVFTDIAGNDNAAGNASSAPVDTLVPEVTISGPTTPVLERFTVTITFSQDVTGFDVSDIVIGSGTATLVPGSFNAVSATEYRIELDPVIGRIVTVDVPANVAFDNSGNANRAAPTYSIQAGSPANEFARYRREIRDAVQAEARRSLQNTMSAHRRLIRQARDRFMLETREEEEGRESVDPFEPALVTLARRQQQERKPYSFESFFEYADGTLNGDASFHYEQGDVRFGARQIVYGDFDVVRDDDGSMTMRTGIRYVLERPLGRNALIGQFLGLEGGRSQIEGAFEGRKLDIGASAGGYVIARFFDNLYFDALVGAVVHRNDLDMNNDVLAVDSDYNTYSTTASMALTGTVGYGRFELWPELALIYGRNDVGSIDMSGHAYGLTDHGLDLDVGAVSIGRATFTPELRIALDDHPVATSQSLFKLAPSIGCQHMEVQSQTHDCGYGGGIALARSNEENTTRLELRGEFERIADTTRAGAMVTFEVLF